MGDIPDVLPATPDVDPEPEEPEELDPEAVGDGDDPSRVAALKVRC
jgi:hypothetical protein